MRRRSLAGVLAFVVGAPAPWSAHDAQALLPIYRDAVRSYQATQTLDEARQLVGTWTREDFEAATEAEARAGDRARLEAAAVFHLEIALAVAPSTPDGAMLHVRLGERLLGGATTAPDEKSGGDLLFRGHWYGSAASIFLAQSDTVRGRQVLERGLGSVPRAAALHLLAGAVEDIEAQRFEPDVAQDAGGSQRALLRNARTEVEGSVRFKLAERAYRQALALDPAHVGARLRLGRVLVLLHRQADARPLLDGALADARTLADRYLARLFLSDLLARDGDVDAARRLLDEARAIAPDRQSAWLALAQLEERTGRPDRARAVVREGLARPGTPATDEWWAYRNGGLDREGFAWLRARVRP